MMSPKTSSGNNAGSSQQFVDDATSSRDSSHCEKTKGNDVPVPVSNIIATSVASPTNVWYQRKEALASRLPTLEEQFQAEKKEVDALRKQILEVKEKRYHQKRLLKVRKEKEQLLKQLEALNSKETDDEDKDDEFSSGPSTPVSQFSSLNFASCETPAPTPRGSDNGSWTKVVNTGNTAKSDQSNSQKRHYQRNKASSPAKQERKGAPATGCFDRLSQNLPTASKLAQTLAEKARPENKVDGVGEFRSVGTSALPSDILNAMKKYKVVCPGELAKLLVDALVLDECKGTCVRGFLNTGVARAALNAGCSTENVKVAVSRFAPAKWRFIRDFLNEVNAPISFFFSEACRNTLKEWSQREWEEACDYLNKGNILLLGADGKPLSGKVVEGLLWPKDK